MTFSVYQYANFAAQQVTVTTLVTLNTVPASTQWLVKNVDITNATGATVATVTFSWGGTVLYNGSIPANQTFHWTGLRVLSAGQTMTIQSSTANSIYVAVDGQTGN